MQYRRRLRTRIVLSFLLLGFGLAVLIASATVLVRQSVEDKVIGRALIKNVDEYAEGFYTSPDRAGVPFEKMTGYVYGIHKIGNVPAAWRDLGPGVHELQERTEAGVRTYKLVVRKDPKYWFFLVYEYSQEHESLQRFAWALVGLVVVFSLLALLVGLWLSRRVMHPVTDLVRRVNALSAEGEPQMLAPHFLDDEVGQLAAALDEYAQRLTHLVRRDREFNADVSHELRTPLAVIHGATELMLASPELSDKMRQRLQRIDRAAQQSTHLITALLMLSRNERGTGDTHLLQLVNHLLDANRAQLAGKPVRLRAQGDASAKIAVPEAIASVTIGNLIGNACKYTAEGEVLVEVASDGVRVFDTGPGISVEDAAHLFERGFRGTTSTGTKGAGIGLSIVGRLCELYGWKVAIAPRGDVRGAVASLSFRPLSGSN
ncbi:MAG: HAMP domain-containing histidine kinase [Proteobacteria bacterium]|nr:HAMP domain-containing histidine kinase [Pseudomonadota bacterium]